MKNNQSLTGGCICGQVKYQIIDKPLFTQACHCKDCKVLTGSSYVVNSSILETCDQTLLSTTLLNIYRKQILEESRDK